ncbi:unnamed protein product [Ostreobium quekettii]|uniref:Uncharacterized protein n=1 Tax=Ostreobium quekettii TaxID=121088 RepID=A0A8S1J4Y1_9CHLO|nr:unnamed protein product [Ostreobium quekettii]
MSAEASPSRGAVEEPEAAVDGRVVPETMPAKGVDTTQAAAPGEASGTEAAKDGAGSGRGIDNQQAKVLSTPPPAVGPCQASPHVRKSLDTALKAVASQVSASPANTQPAPVVPPAPALPPGQEGNVTQLTDILLAKLITSLSDSALGNPALLLQTLLGFSPEDYNDLLAALSESGCSYVDIIAAYLHNIRVMSEDAGSTSAALSGTLTRSLIEQYNALLAQALRTPRNGMARPGGVGDMLGQGSQDLGLNPANGSISGRPPPGAPNRRSFDNAMNRGPSGLGFGRRSLDSARPRPPMLLDPQGRGVGLQGMMQGEHTGLAQAGDAPHQKQPASIDLGQMLSGSDVPSPAMASQPGMNPLMLHPQVLAGHTPEQLASILENVHLQQGHPYVHPGVTLPMANNAVGGSHVGSLNPAMGVVAPTMPAMSPLPAGLGPNGSPLSPGAAQALAGHGLVPQWTHASGVNGQTPLSHLHLMQQTGAVPQGWEHMSTIDETRMEGMP